MRPDMMGEAHSRKVPVRWGAAPFSEIVRSMHDSIDATTVVFAVLAVFVIWKLRSVLGSRTGAEKPPGRFGFGREAPPRPDGDGKVIRLPGAAEAPVRQVPVPPPAADRWAGIAAPGSPVAAGLDAIAGADPGFDAAAFLAGAKSAYEIIVSAFAAGDRATLQGLLAPDVYDSFQQVIAAREGRGETVANTFVSMDEAVMEAAQMKDRAAQITVRFACKLISATRDKAGAIVDGSAEQVIDTNDVWTFAREAGARDPNWKLVATQAGA